MNGQPPDNANELRHGRESPRERVQRLLAEGKITEQALSSAEGLWRERLREGILLPNGESASMTLDDMYHVIVDPRIWRKPWRIERLLVHVYELYEAEHGRRIGVSRWEEDGGTVVGYVILEHDGSVATLHLVDASRLERLTRGKRLIWKQ